MRETKLLKYKEDLIALTIACLASLTLTYSFLDLKNADLHIPMNCYGHNDVMSLSYRLKSMLETGWVFKNNSVGMPIGATFYDMPSTEVVILLCLNLLVHITGHYGLAINIWYIFTFTLTTIISYMCMRRLRVKSYWAVLGALTYAFLAYHFKRNTMHLLLSTYSFIPVALVIIMETFRDEAFYQLDKHFFKKKKNRYAFIGLLLVGMTGFYYAFFSCFLIVLMGISHILKEHRVISRGKQMLMMLGNVILPIGLSMLPNLIMQIQNGRNMEAPIRSVGEAEVFGMKIIQLILPIESKIDSVQKIADRYYQSTYYLQGENSEYLGIIGSIGFLILISHLLIRQEDRQLSKQLHLLKEMNIGLVLLGTISGLGALFALVVSPQIRAYNRVSVIIAFLSITAVCLILSNHLEWSKAKGRICIIGLVFLVGIWEQSTGRPNHNLSKQIYESDEAFVKEIEAKVPEGSMIYQLPYCKYPEVPNINEMKEYSLFRGYLHSNTLKWSYGGYKGRTADKWHAYVNSLEMEERIQRIADAGFVGIYIDRSAYTLEEMGNLQAQLTQILGQQPLYSQQGDLMFYNMLPYIERYQNGWSQAQIEERRKKTVSIVPQLKAGVYGEESYEGVKWRWMQNKAELEIENLSDERIEIVLSAYIYSMYEEPCHFTVEVNGEQTVYVTNQLGINVEQRITLLPGKNTILFYTNAKRVETNEQEERLLFIRADNPKIEIVF